MSITPSCSVLFVDDETAFLHSIRRTFRKKKMISVYTAPSAEKAFEYLEKNKIDIIFSDLRMPGMQGDAFLREVREKYPHTCRSLFTAYPQVSSLSELVNSGVINRFYIKPYDLVELSQEIEHINKDLSVKALTFSHNEKTPRQSGGIVAEYHKIITQAKRNTLELLEIKDFFSSTVAMGNALNRERDSEKLFRLILNTLARMTNADAGTIYYVERDEQKENSKNMLRIKYALNNSVNISYEENVIPLSSKSIAGYAALSGTIVNIPDVRNIPKDTPYNFDDTLDRRFCYKTVSMITIPLINQRDEVLGVIQLINRKEECGQNVQIKPFEEHLRLFIKAIANQAAIALDNVNLIEKQKKQFDEFIRSAVTAIEERDPATAGHSERVAALSLLCAGKIGKQLAESTGKEVFSPEAIKELEYAALLHDFGKVYIDPNLFVKAKKLYPWDLRFLKSRFEYLHALVDMEFLRKEAVLYKRVKDIDTLGEFLIEITDEQKNMHRVICDFQQELEHMNESNLLHEETIKKLKEIQQHIEAYVSKNRKKGQLPVMDEHMICNLSIPRGTLNEEERRIIQNHVEHTYNFVKSIPWPRYLARIPEICRNHHEFLDGTGYPRGIQANKIPIQSRIITVADIYDALTASDRPYKKAVPHKKALQIIQEEADKNHLDQGIVDTLKAIPEKEIKEAFHEKRVISLNRNK